MKPLDRLLETFGALGGDGFNDWHLGLGARLPRGGVALLAAAAVAALALSTITLVRDRRRRRGLIFTLRLAALAACLMVALQPVVELRQIVHVPNRVAVLVDASRSMEVRPPDGGRSRAERAAALLAGTAPERVAWEQAGHRVDLYTFGEGLAPATVETLGAAPPAADATRIGEALAELRARYAGRDLGAVVVISDGIDTGRIGKGPLDAETRAEIAGLGAPVHTVGIGERELRDLSVVTVLADEFAFVRTPVTIEAVVRQSGLPDRQVDVTLTRDGRPIEARSVILKGASSEEKIAFDWVPDHPGNFVFQIAAPVLGGEALAGNNAQVFTVKVIRDRVRVLHLCGRPSWDERFLRAMLRRDPNVDLVSFFILRTESDEQPWNRSELSLIPFPTYEIFEEQLRSFDLVLFQNFNYEPYGVEPFLPGLRDYVEGGGALAMIGGELSFAGGGYGATPLRDVLPVELPPGGGLGGLGAGAGAGGGGAVTTDVFKPRLTPEGRVHPVTSLVLDPRDNEARWSRLPALEGINQVQKLKPGAVPLLVHPTARDGAGKPAPVLAVGEANKGRVLALLTDTAWHWGFIAAGEGDDGRAFQRFWENAIRWLVRDPALTLLRVDLDRVEYRRQQPPAVRVRAVHADYSPARDVHVKLSVAPAEGPGTGNGAGGGDGAAGGAAGRGARELEVTTDAQGESHVDLGLLAPGAYRLTGRATIDGRDLSEDKTFVVRAEGRELEDVAFRDGVLREIAELSGGSYRAGSLAGIKIREPREVRIGRRRQVELWSRPGLLALAVALLALEWAVRRRAGYS